MQTTTSGTRRALATWGLAALLALSAPAWAQLRIGQPSGFTGAVSAGVKENTEGAKLYLDAVNARGGVNGQKIELISVDDKFDPKVTLEVARELVTRQNVLALFLNRGTPHAQALLPLLERVQSAAGGPQHRCHGAARSGPPLGVQRARHLSA